MVFHNFKFGFLDSILVYWVERKILWGRLSREGFSPTGWYSPQNRPLYLPTDPEAAKADAVMAELLAEEEGREAKKGKRGKKKKAKKPPQEKGDAPNSPPDMMPPVSLPHAHQPEHTAAAAAAKKHVTEEADAVLRAALDSKEDLDLLVAAINDHGEHASPERLKEARSARDEIKHRRKKAARQEKREAERLAQAEALLRLIVNEEGISELQAAIVEAQGLAGVAASLDAEVLVAQERLIDLRAAAKTSAIEDQQDLLEEHAVASALQGLSLAPEPDRKPSAEEKEVTELTGRIEEMERRKEAAVAEEDYLKAAEIKRSIAELVEHREAVEKAIAQEDTKRSAAAAGPEASEAAECVICMDQRKNHVLVPCGHLCVCQACADRIMAEGETCPICRTAVREAVAVYQ